MNYEDDIPPEYLLHQPGNQNFTLAEFAETVTPEALPYLHMRLVHESKTEEYQINILEMAAKKLDRRTGELWREFREYQKSGNNVNNKMGRFRFLPISELYSMSGPTDWVVKSYLDKGSLAMLFGKSETLKSFAAIDIGLSVATGTDWHGNRVSQGTVFYICGEGKKGISRRLRAWELHHSISHEKASFFVSNRPAQFLNEESAMEVVAAVNELCEQHGKPVLIIIDTLNRNFGPGDESSTADMTTFVHVIDTNLRLHFDCTVFIVHHTGLQNQDRARGAYSLHAALDWIYKAEKQHMTLTLSNQKAKDFENLPPVFLKAEIITLDWVEEDGGAMTSLILRSTTDTVKKNRPLTGTNKIAYDTLIEGIKENGGNPIHIDTWRAAAYQANISKSDKPDTKQKAFTRAKEYLHREGLIETKDDYWKPTQDNGHKEDI